jgi:predicted nuclease of predicted toxin-antitoxin system
MRFKIDENLPIEACGILADAGHDAASVFDQNLSGASDPRVHDVCRLEDRIIVTMDLDFANVRAYPSGESPGIVVLRLARQDKDRVLAAIGDMVSMLDAESPERCLWIVEDDRIRIRR